MVIGDRDVIDLEEDFISEIKKYEISFGMHTHTVERFELERIFASPYDFINARNTKYPTYLYDPGFGILRYGFKDMPWRDLAEGGYLVLWQNDATRPEMKQIAGLSYPGYRGITVKFTDSYGIGKWLYWELGELNPTGEMVNNFKYFSQSLQYSKVGIVDVDGNWVLWERGMDIRALVEEFKKSSPGAASSILDNKIYQAVLDGLKTKEGLGKEADVEKTCIVEDAVSVVLKPEVYEDNKFRVVYTKSADFEAITALTSREELPSVLTLGGVRFLEPGQDELPDKSAALLKDAFILAERMDLTNVLWSNPMDGAVAVILKNPASEKSKAEILKVWTRSLVATGLAGRQLIVKLELGTDELDMSVIQDAYKKSLVELSKQGIDISCQSEIFAASRRLKDGGWPQRQWKLTAQGAKRNLDTLSYLLKKYSQDLKEFNLNAWEKTGVIIHGAGFIGLTVAEVISLDKNYILRGIADARAAIYDYEGLERKYPKQIS